MQRELGELHRLLCARKQATAALDVQDCAGGLRCSDSSRDERVGNEEELFPRVSGADQSASS
jgi:hypothetical protein